MTPSEQLQRTVRALGRGDDDRASKAQRAIDLRLWRASGP